MNAENIRRYEESIGVPWSAFQPSHLFIIRGTPYSVALSYKNFSRLWHAC